MTLLAVAPATAWTRASLARDFIVRSAAGCFDFPLGIASVACSGTRATLPARPRISKVFPRIPRRSAAKGGIRDDKALRQKPTSPAVLFPPALQSNLRERSDENVSLIL